MFITLPSNNSGFFPFSTQMNIVYFLLLNSRRKAAVCKTFISQIKSNRIE